MVRKFDRLAEIARSLHASTSATLSGRQLYLVRVGWLVIFALSIGVYFASIPAYYDWFINFADPDLEAGTVRANLNAAGISIDFYATYLLSIHTVSAILWCAGGAIIFWRRSDDGMALFSSLSLVLFGVFFLNDGPDALAEQYSAMWLPVHLLSFFGSVSFYLFFFLFPNGRFVPRWLYWAPILWAAHEVAYYFFPASIFNLEESFPLVDPVVVLTFLCIGIGAQLYRYRRVSGPVQREQTKWVVLGMVSAGLGAVGFGLVINSFPTMLLEFGSPYAFVFETGILLAMLLIPLSIGVAILRHRLWDVDIVINRTLVYGTLTALLALVYLGGVTASEATFRALTAREHQPQLAIVISTLVIAALFNPLRRRIQTFIDRRFYRRKYDARKTLEAFSIKLRDETNLDALRDDLIGVVRETMQPAHVSLWLRPDTVPRREQPDR